MNSKHTDSLIAIILFHDMECVLTRETILESVSGMDYKETLITLQDWAIRLMENSQFLMDGEED